MIVPTYLSDNFVEKVLAADEQVFPEQVRQLARDFKTLKNRFINLCIWEEAGQEWDALPEEEKEKQRQRARDNEKKLRKIWDNNENLPSHP